MISPRAWAAFMAAQHRAGAVPEVSLESGTGSDGTLAIGCAEGELFTLRQAYGGSFTHLSLDNGDMHCMSYASGAFQRTFASNVLEHSPAPYFALLEIRRVTQASGEVHIAMPQFDGPEGGGGMLHVSCLDAKVWGGLLRKVGLEVVEQCFEAGVYEPRAGYHIFHCRAGKPEHPHDWILNEVWSER